MQYEKNVIYSLKVTGSFVRNDKYYYLIENEGIKYKVKMLKFQQKLPVPEEIKCVVYGYDADDTPLFAQHKGEIAQKLYTIGNIYPFVVLKKANSPSDHRNLFYGYDANGIRVFIQAGIGQELNRGRNVRCTVKHISPEGYLFVVPVNQEDKETNFLSFEQLMYNIHTEMPPSCVQLETLQSEAAGNSKIQQMLKQYENHEGEWLLSFLSILLAKREEKIEQKAWDEVCELINYQHSIIEWVLEDSTFLTFYSSSVIQSVREKGEREILICEAILQAIELIRTNAVEDFFKRIFTKIHTSGYLSNRDRKIDLLIALFRLDDALVDKNMTTLTEFCQYVTSVTESNAPVLISVIELLKKIIDKNISTGNPASTKMLHLLAISVLLCHTCEMHTMMLHRIMLYRYASLVNPRASKVLINKAYDALTQSNQFYRPEFTWNDILYFKPDLFVAKLRSFIINDGVQLTAQHITQGSRMLLRNGTFVLYAGCTPESILSEDQKVSEILSVFDNRISIFSKKEIKPKSTELQNIFVLKNLWEKLYEQLSRKMALSTNTSSIKMLPSEGMRMKIKLKSYNSRYPLMMFADVAEPGYVGTGALLANEVTRIHIQSMQDLFYEGDMFEATVLKVGQNDRLTFSIAQELFEFVAGTVKFGQRVYAKLTRLSKGSCIWICEDGYTLFSPDKAPSPEIGTIALMEIRDVNNTGYINAVYIEEADETIQINEVDALSKLIGEYINFCSPQEEKAEEEENFGQPFVEEDEIQPEVQLSLPLIHELAWLLAVRAESESSLIVRYNLLGTARLLTKITNDSDLCEYLSLLMNYEENIYSFATYREQARWTNFSRIDDEAVARYPSLESKKELLQILTLFHSHTFDSSLALGIATTKDQNKEHIIRLVLAHALLFHTLPPTALVSLHSELLQRIGAGDYIVSEEQDTSSLMPEKKEELSYLGRENEKVEFKSSVVYPAGDTIPNMKQQSEIILQTIAGFLNGFGGTLYIGVANTGLAIGLKEDYAYMQCTSDGYELFIRQRIITTLGKDINSIIKIEFPQYGNREVCCITIPCYGKLIELKGVVWQRQGNLTVLLDGNALAKQQKRKNDILQTEINQITESNLELVSENLLQTNEMQTVVAAAFAASLEKKKKKSEEKTKKNTIQTSLIRTSCKDGEDTEGKVITYLSLLDNGNYILEDECSNMDNAILTLAINAEERDGSLLLCYENAYVNRVPLKILLKKKRDYVYKKGVNKDLHLIFATIENGEPYILVRTLRQKSEYLKMFPLSKIKENMDIALKGTPLFSYNFGKAIAWEVIPEAKAKKLQKLCNDNLDHQGFLCTSEALLKERELLQQWGWKIDK